MKLKSNTYYRRIYYLKRTLEIIVFTLSALACAVLMLRLLPMIDTNLGAPLFKKGAPKIGILYSIFACVFAGLCCYLVEEWRKRNERQKGYDYIVGILFNINKQ